MLWIFLFWFWFHLEALIFHRIYHFSRRFWLCHRLLFQFCFNLFQISLSRNVSRRPFMDISVILDYCFVNNVNAMKIFGCPKLVTPHRESGLLLLLLWADSRNWVGAQATQTHSFNNTPPPKAIGLLVPSWAWYFEIWLAYFCFPFVEEKRKK